MQPTNELRWLERINGESPHQTFVWVLQQKWAGWKPTGNKHPFKETEDVIEWRDVPVVKEESK